jgi:PDZ domain
MRSAGVLTSKAREHGAFGASLAASMFVLFASALASAQSAPAAPAVASPAAAASAAPAPAAASTSSGAIAEIPASVPPAPAANPSNMVSTPPPQDLDATAPSNAGIPVDALQQQMSAPAPDSQDGSEIARYQEEQSGMPPEQLKALQQFDSEGQLTTPFGMELEEAKRSLKSGEDADGLLIVAVAKGSPAATAGLRPYSHTVHDAIAAAAMVGAVFSGGLSVVVIPAIDYMQVGESYDMIIGVDGSRVTNFLDFQDRIHDLQPGEIIYLSVLRDGKRLQVTMPVTTDVVQSTTN